MFTVDGQKIAKKLSVQIGKESKKLKELRGEFNAIRTINDNSVVELKDLFDSAKLLDVLSSVTSSLHCYSETTRKAIDLFLTIERTAEEIALLRTEMDNIATYYSTRNDNVKKISTSFAESDEPYNRGAVALLWKLRENSELMTQECSKIYSSEPVISDSDSDEDI